MTTTPTPIPLPTMTTTPRPPIRAQLLRVPKQTFDLALNFSALQMRRELLAAFPPGTQVVDLEDSYSLVMTAMNALFGHLRGLPVTERELEDAMRVAARESMFLLAAVRSQFLPVEPE